MVNAVFEKWREESSERKLTSSSPGAASPLSLANRKSQIANRLSRIEKGEKRGSLFWPQYNFKQSERLDKTLIKPTGSAKRVIALLKKAKQKGIALSIIGHLRGVDGPGSSLDLPEFQKALTEIGATRLENLPSTPTIASAFTVKIRFELADDPRAIEYIAPDYGITKDRPYKIRGKVKLTPKGKTPHGQKDAPAYIFSNIFGLSGIRIICEGISPLALAGGMESSNVFNVALIAGASMLSGADLSLADIFNLAVKLENDEFGGLTGGQGHLCCMLAGAFRHIWLSGIKDAKGKLINPYAAFSIPLLSKDKLSGIEKHMLLVQAGKEYKDGKQVIVRTAALINQMWTDLLRDKDEIGLPLHQEKLGLTARYAQALKDGDFKTAVETINRYVDIRDQLCLRWINLMLDAEQSKAVPGYAKEYARKVFNKKYPEYEDNKVVREMYKEHEGALRTMSFYTLEPIAGLVMAARGQGIAIMPLGAGGPGANLIAVSPKGIGHLKKFLRKKGLDELTGEEVTKIIRGTGTLKGYMTFKVGRRPLIFSSFKKLGLNLPQRPQKVSYKEVSATSPLGGGQNRIIRLVIKNITNSYEGMKAFIEKRNEELRQAGINVSSFLFNSHIVYWYDFFWADSLRKNRYRYPIKYGVRKIYIYGVPSGEGCIIVSPHHSEEIKTEGIYDCVGVALKGFKKGIFKKREVIGLTHISSAEHFYPQKFIKYIREKQGIEITSLLISYHKDKKESIKRLSKELQRVGITIFLHQSRQKCYSSEMTVNSNSITIITSKIHGTERIKINWKGLTTSSPIRRFKKYSIENLFGKHRVELFKRLGMYRLDTSSPVAVEQSRQIMNYNIVPRIYRDLLSSSRNFAGEITGILRNVPNFKRWLSRETMMILRQEGLLTNPEIKTLVSTTALSMSFFSVGLYFLYNLFLRNRELSDAGVNIFENLSPAQAKRLFLQLPHKHQFIFGGKALYGLAYLLWVNFYGKFGHLIQPPFDKKDTIYPEKSQGVLSTSSPLRGKEVAPSAGVQEGLVASSAIFGGKDKREEGRKEEMDKLLKDGKGVLPFQTDILKHWDKVKGVIQGKTVPPLFLEIQPIGTCQFSCKPCPFRMTFWKEHWIRNYHSVQEMMKGAYDYGVRRVIFSGYGEPTVHPNIYDFIEYAKVMGMQLGLCTNGLWGGKIVSKIAEIYSNSVQDNPDKIGTIRRQNYINVSIDSVEQGIYGDGDRSLYFSTTTDNLRKYIGYTKEKRSSQYFSPVVIIASYMIYKRNYRDIERFVKERKDERVDKVRLDFPVAPINPALRNLREYGLEGVPIQEVFGKIRELREQYGDFIICTSTEERLLKTPSGKADYEKSYSEHFTALLRPDEKFYPQTYSDFLEEMPFEFRGYPQTRSGKKEDLSFGNVSGGLSFQEIWEGKRRKEVLSLIDPRKCYYTRADDWLNLFCNWLSKEYEKSGDEFFKWVEKTYEVAKSSSSSPGAASPLLFKRSASPAEDIAGLNRLLLFILLALFAKKEGYILERVREGNIKLFEEAFSSNKVEANAQAGREPYSGLESEVSDSHRKVIQIYGYPAAIADRYIYLFASLVVYTNAHGFRYREDRERSPAVNIAFAGNPEVLFLMLYLYRNNGAIEDVGEGYLLHNTTSTESRSSLRGMGSPIGATLYFSLNSLSTLVTLVSFTGKTLCLAISTNSPPYLSINFLKLFFNHFWSSALFTFTTSKQIYITELPLSQGVFWLPRKTGEVTSAASPVGEGKIELLIQLLRSDDPVKRKEGIKELGRAGKGNQEVARALQELLAKERAMDVRLLALKTLKEIQDEPAKVASEKWQKSPVHLQCPGSEKVKEPQIVEIKCPKCHTMVEAVLEGWETQITCTNQKCGITFNRELPPSCIERCPKGKECVGVERYEKYMKGRERPGGSSSSVKNNPAASPAALPPSSSPLAGDFSIKDSLIKLLEKKRRSREEWLVILKKSVALLPKGIPPTLKNVAQLLNGKVKGEKNTARNIARLLGYKSPDNLRQILYKHSIGYKEIGMRRAISEPKSRQDWVEYLMAIRARLPARAPPTPRNVAGISNGELTDGDIRSVLSGGSITYEEIGMIRSKSEGKSGQEWAVIIKDLVAKLSRGIEPTANNIASVSGGRFTALQLQRAIYSHTLSYEKLGLIRDKRWQSRIQKQMIIKAKALPESKIALGEIARQRVEEIKRIISEYIQKNPAANSEGVSGKLKINKRLVEKFLPEIIGRKDYEDEEAIF